MTLSSSKALIVFARHPVPGRVKTRLTPPLSPAEAARLYECMLRDVLTKTAPLAGVARLLFYAEEPGALPFFRELVPAVPLFPQRGEDLGIRMLTAFRETFSLGYREVAIIGSDSPDLPLVHIEAAFARLADGRTDAVFGPSEDGGYYLIGLTAPHEALFTGIPWSTENVLAESLARGEDAGLTISLAPVWHDVDTADDLLRDELRDGGNGAPLTRGFLAKWERRSPAR